MPRESRKRRRKPSEEEESSEGRSGSGREEEEGVVISSEEEGEKEHSEREEEASEEEDSSEDEGGEERRSSRRRSSKRKRSKKAKRAKKKKKKKHRHRRHREEDSEEKEASSARKRPRRHGSESEEDDTEKEDDGNASTDREGGSTPELPEIDEDIVLEKVVEKKRREETSRPVERRETLEEEGEIRDSRDSRPEERKRKEEERQRERDGGRRDKETKTRRGRGDDRRGRDDERSRRSRRSRTRSRSPHHERREQREQQAPSGRLGELPPEPVKTEERPKDEPEGATAAGGSSKVISLSVEETNKLRASLGLAPLKVEGAANGGSGGGDIGGGGEEDEAAAEQRRRAEEQAKALGGTLIPNSKKNEVHVPPENWSEKSKADKIREKIKQRRIKREQESRLLSLRKLGDSDSEEGDTATNWVDRQKEVQRAKLEAAKRAKALEELDDEFGVGFIVDEDSKKTRASAYDRKDLSGLKVEHDVDHFAEGKSVILTLKDADVLDDEAADTLVNVNMADDDHARKRVDDAKKARTGYNAYDMEEVDELTGEVKRKNMLDKYDEEIEGLRKKAFVIGQEGKFSAEEERERERKKIKERLKLNARRLESLESPAMRIVSDYMTKEEADAKFKKPKKKKKKLKQKMLKADDLLAGAEESFGRRTRSKTAKAAQEEKEVGGFRRVGGLDDEDEDDGLEIKPEVSNIKVEEEDEEQNLDAALEKARRMKQSLLAARAAATEEEAASDLAAERVLREVKSEPVKTEEEDATAGSEFIPTFEDQQAAGSSIILNETAEFCRNLGSRQMSHEMELGRYRKKKGDRRRGTGATEVDDGLLDFEESLMTSATRQHEERRGRWEERKSRHKMELKKRLVDWKKVDDTEEVAMEIDSDDNGGGGAGDWRAVTDSSEASSSRKGRAAILEEEPDLQQGVAAAITVADRKGYWDKEEKRSTGQTLKHLMAKNYTIDDKMRADDGGERSRGRERYGGGATTSFQEKQGWKPNVKLEYIDDSGRLLNSKEAFRYLSHKFHGKGSGKMKTEKRMKKIMEEGLMKNMSSTDTPLQTLEKLRRKQAEGATPYVVLTGNKLNPQDLKK